MYPGFYLFVVDASNFFATLKYLVGFWIVIFDTAVYFLSSEQYGVLDPKTRLATKKTSIKTERQPYKQLWKS
jgi:hypothetical protein